MKRLIPIFLVGLAACNQPTTEPTISDGTAVVWTKTMDYAVDLNSAFHEDLNDEDFSDVSQLTEQLIGDVLSGKLKAYERGTEKVLSTAEVKAMLQFTDTIWFEQPETGDVSIDILERDYTAEFFGLTFREQWSYNESGSIIDRKIRGLAPRIPVYSSRGGDLRGYTSAFWIKYE